MKNKIIFVFFIVLASIGILYTSNIKTIVADGSSSINNLNLKCDKTLVSSGSNINCTLTGTVTGASGISDLSIVDGGSNYLTLSSLEQTNSFGGGKTILATAVFKAANISTSAKGSPAKAVLKVSYSVEVEQEKEETAGEETPPEKIKKTETVYGYSEDIRIGSTINTLSNIKIDGSSIPGFNKDELSYNIFTKSSKVNITIVRGNSLQSIVGIGERSLSCGNNTAKIVVTPEIGGVKKTYTLNINRVCENSADLRSITLSNGILTPTFNPNITDYTVNVEYEVNKISITGVKSLNTQKISGNVKDQKIKLGDNKFDIIVTSQTGNKKVYSINVVRQKQTPDEALLSSLSFSNGIINFDKNTFNYTVTVLYGVTDIEVIATPTMETATVTVTGNKNLSVGENQIKILVKSKKGAENTYTVKVNRLKEGETLGNNPNIKKIIVKGYDLLFDYNKKDYKLVINKEDKLDIEVIMDDPSSTYEIIGNSNLKDDSVISIITTSQDGHSEKYTITVTKASQTIYYVIGASLIFLAIVTPIIVYFVFVKKRKQNVDVNGYVIEKKKLEKKKKDKKKLAISNTINNQPINSFIKQTPVVTNQGNVIASINNAQTISGNNNPNVTNQTIAPIVNNTVASENGNLSVYNGANAQNNISNSNVVTNQTANVIEQTKPLINNYEVREDETVEVEAKDLHTTSCPNCGRELLGNPSICPYCKGNLDNIL